MLRIVSGAWGGRRISAPRGRGTRPTSEKVRAAIFNVLTHRVDLHGKCVWDLYAGSGAMGIEALSRGAGHATFVESDGRAAGGISSNLKGLAADPSRWSVMTGRVETWLSRAPVPTGPLLIFMDPPYRSESGPSVLEMLAASERVPDGSIIVLERAREADSRRPAALELWQSKRYGGTEVRFLVKGAAERDDAHHA
jgi:16S rRNA (guanine966-N2)-methyltransferase